MEETRNEEEAGEADSSSGQRALHYRPSKGQTQRISEESHDDGEGRDVIRSSKLSAVHDTLTLGQQVTLCVMTVVVDRNGCHDQSSGLDP